MEISKCTLTDECVREVWYIPIMKHYLSLTCHLQHKNRPGGPYTKQNEPDTKKDKHV